MKISIQPSSFRDPSGFVFKYGDRLLRQINDSYRVNYDHLNKSGLYDHLVKAGSLVPHQEVNFPQKIKGAYKIIEPEQVPFISYPYEWCFGQLRDAALLTLGIQKESLAFGMSLKDASSFNIQFVQGQPIFIDTLSFEVYEEGKPWVAYRQFCEHFLGPLALAAYTDSRLAKLTQVYPDGIPLDLIARLLPFSAKIQPLFLLHLVLHAKSQKRPTGKARLTDQTKRFDRNAIMGLVESLEGATRNLQFQEKPTVWSDYYDRSSKVSYQDHALEEKKVIVGKYLDMAGVATLWDIGANTGVFSQIAAAKGIFTISMDSDVTAVEKNYQLVQESHEKNILPLWLDMTNPSPALGWESSEREALLSRPLPDAVMALALLHHLAIGKNLPLAKLAQFFARLCHYLIIEFVPKEDSQVQLMLQNREDIFPDYNQASFEKEFARHFNIKEKSALPDSGRILYLMSNRHRP